jgi:hypothetical protein
MPTAIEKIQAKAKALRKSYPNAKWTDLIKKASTDLKKIGSIGATSKKKKATKKAATKKAVSKRKPKVVKVLKQRGTSAKAYDKRHQALQAGRRISKSGRPYTETRSNRSDKGVLLGVRKPKTLEDLGIGRKKYALENYQGALKTYQFIETRLNHFKIAYKSPLMTKQDKMALKKEIVVLTKMLSSQKKGLTELKKYL